MEDQAATIESDSLNSRAFTLGDPLLRFLTRHRVAPAVVGILYSLVFQTLRAVVAWRAGHLRTTGSVTGFVNDPAVYTNLVFASIIVGYYIWMPRGIASVFTHLEENQIIGEPIAKDKEAELRNPTFRERILLLGQRWGAALVLVVTIPTILILVRPQYLTLQQSAAWAADGLSLVLSLLWIAVGLYCALHLFLSALLAIRELRRRFREFRVLIRPLHPDKSGGLAPLGDFALRLSYLLALIGVAFVVTPVTRNLVVTGTLQFRWSTELQIGLVAYILAAPVVFFAPLAVAHNAMKEAKHRLLLQVARRFEREYERVNVALDGDLSGLENRLKTLKELQSLHETTDKFPVWPFNVQNLTRFGTSYLSPVAIALVIDFLSRFF